MTSASAWPSDAATRSKDSPKNFLTVQNPHQVVSEIAGKRNTIRFMRHELLGPVNLVSKTEDNMSRSSPVLAFTDKFNNH